MHAPPPTHADRIAVAGGAAPDADRLAALQVTREASIVAAAGEGDQRGRLLRHGAHPLARAPTAVARVRALMDGGLISSTLAACG